jgi:hypothetical protein
MSFMLSVIMLCVIKVNVMAQSISAQWRQKPFYNIDKRLWLTSWSKNIWTQQKFAPCSLSVINSFLPYLDLIKNIFDQIKLYFNKLLRFIDVVSSVVN